MIEAWFASTRLSCERKLNIRERSCFVYREGQASQNILACTRSDHSVWTTITWEVWAQTLYVISLVTLPLSTLWTGTDLNQKLEGGGGGWRHQWHKEGIKKIIHFLTVLLISAYSVYVWVLFISIKTSIMSLLPFHVTFGLVETSPKVLGHVI